MSVTAVPTTPATTTTGCAAQSTVTPEVYTLFDIPVPTKMRAAVVKQKQAATLQVKLFDRSGNPTDLTTCGISNSTTASTAVKVRVSEATGLVINYTEINGATPDAANGLTSFDLTDASFIDSPGIYLAEIGVFGSGTALKYSDTVYLMVERGLFGGDPQGGGPPTIHEIRLALADHAEAQRLLDNNQFDVADICQAITVTAQEWNSASPPLGFGFRTDTFPRDWAGQWLWGIRAYLYSVISGFYLANQLEYQAAGVAVNDLGKHQLFQALSDKYRQMWMDWVRRIKTAINIDAGYAIHGSQYGHIGAW